MNSNMTREEAVLWEEGLIEVIKEELNRYELILTCRRNKYQVCNNDRTGLLEEFDDIGELDKYAGHCIRKHVNQYYYNDLFLPFSEAFKYLILEWVQNAAPPF